MRSLALGLFLAVSALPAGAQPVETVTVDDDSPVGLWKFDVPESVHFALFGQTKWGPAMTEFCEIEKFRGQLTAHCPGLHIAGEDVSHGTVALHGNRLRLAWGSMLHAMAINGALGSGQFEGTFSATTLGISSQAPNPVIGQRLALSANMPDRAGKAGLLVRSLDEMAKGSFATPLDAKGTNIRILKPETLQALGDVQSIIYIGDKALTVSNDPFNVYDVEFASGHLICELRQGVDSEITYFDCG